MPALTSIDEQSCEMFHRKLPKRCRTEVNAPLRMHVRKRAILFLGKFICVQNYATKRKTVNEL